MKLAIPTICALVALSPSVSAAGQESVPPSHIPLVTSHHHRCDYKVRPFKDPNGRIVNLRIRTYTDPESGITLRVEKDGRHLDGIHKDGKVLWRTDPHQGVMPYRADPACIFAIGPKSYLALPPPSRPYPVGDPLLRKRVEIREGVTGHYVFLNFDNSQMGFVDVRTGKFYFLGQN